MSQEDIEHIILTFLRESVHAAIELDTRLVDDGVIDSLGVVELITFIESTFDVRITIAGLSLRDLHDVRAIAEFVRQLAPTAAHD